MRAFLLALLLASCAPRYSADSNYWYVGPHTTIQQLDERYQREVRGLKEVCEPYDNYIECPEYIAVWRAYWSARRRLEM